MTGNGADTITVGDNGLNDYVTDFNPQVDVINLQVDVNDTTIDSDAEALAVCFNFGPNHVLVNLGPVHAIILEGVQKADLDGANVTFFTPSVIIPDLPIVI